MPDLLRKSLDCGVTVYAKGPPFELGPLPSLIYFSLSGPDTLALDPFNQPVAFLESDHVRIFSFSLPFHDEYDKREVIKVWIANIQEGNNFITPFVRQIQKAVDELIETDVIDPEFCAVGGLSRGSFIATHLAAIEPRIRALLGFAPLTKLSVSSSFQEIHGSTLLDQLNLGSLKEELVKRAVRFYIGNRDTMVQTTACYEFVRELTDYAYDQGIRSPQVELMITPSIGHKGHGTSPESFRDGANWIKTQLGLTK